MTTERLPRPPARRWSSARSCAASRRSSSTAAPASRPTGWASGGCPTDEILEVGARMAAVRGISHCYERPTYADWPYSVFTMAHGRSKEECDAILDSIADEHDLHGDDRAVLYSSTEFKKIRLHYFTDDYARLGSASTPERSTAPRRLRLDTRALRGALRAAPSACCPAGSTRRSGRCARSAANPIFVERGEGCRADRRRRQPLRRLGLLLGAADPRPRPPGGRRGGRARPPRGAPATARRPRARSSSRPRSRERFASVEMVRMVNSGTEAAMSAVRLARAATGREQAGQVRRRLPRPRRRPARRGRLRPRDAGDPGQPGRHRGAGGGHDRRPLERPRGASRAALAEHEVAAILAEPIAGEHGRGPAAPTASSSSCASSPTRTARCSSSTR